MRRPTPTPLAALVAVALVVGGCAGEDDGGVVADGAAPTTPGTSATTSTTLPATTTSTTVLRTPLPTGREAIDALLAAWEAGDRVAASLVATPEAVEAIFAVPVEGRDDRGCNGTSVQVNVQCVFQLPSGELQVRAAPTPDGTGFLVDFVLLGS